MEPGSQSDYDKYLLAKDLSASGKTTREVSLEVGVPKSTVARWLAKGPPEKRSSRLRSLKPKKFDAPWAQSAVAQSEAMGHAMAARILELAEPAITRAIREAAWKAIEELRESM